MRTPHKSNCCSAKDQRDRKSGQLKLLRQQNKRLIKLNQKLQGRVTKLEAQYEPRHLDGHRYPLQLITLSVFMVSHANASLRCTARVIGFLIQELNWNFTTPSPATISTWAQRIGVFALSPESITDDGQKQFVGIIDESVQIGGHKILLLLGYPLKALRQGLSGTINMKQLRVLGVEVRQSWPGNDISQWLNRQQDRLAIQLKYLVCDGGTNLMASVRQLGINRVSDCTHVLMNLLKAHWAKDENYKAFIDEVQKLRPRWSMTPLAFLLPMKLRKHDRFCHLFVLTKWSHQVIEAWDNLPQKARDKLSFVKDNHSFIERMTQARDLVEMAAQLLKTKGLSCATEMEWRLHLTAYTCHETLFPIGQLIIDGVNQYFDQHRHLYDDQEVLICYSDIIESIFGKYKNKSGPPMIGPDVLYIPLYCMDITEQFVERAMKSVNGKALQKWKDNNLCENRYGTKLRLRKLTKMTSPERA